MKTPKSHITRIITNLIAFAFTCLLIVGMIFAATPKEANTSESLQTPLPKYVESQRVYDETGTLNDNQVSEILNEIRQNEQKYGFRIVIFITNTQKFNQYITDEEHLKQVYRKYCTTDEENVLIYINQNGAQPTVAFTHKEASEKSLQESRFLLTKAYQRFQAESKKSFCCAIQNLIPNVCKAASILKLNNKDKQQQNVNQVPSSAAINMLFATTVGMLVLTVTISRKIEQKDNDRKAINAEALLQDNVNEPTKGEEKDAKINEL